MQLQETEFVIAHTESYRIMFIKILGKNNIKPTQNLQKFFLKMEEEENSQFIL